MEMADLHERRLNRLHVLWPRRRGRIFRLLQQWKAGKITDATFCHQAWKLEEQFLNDFKRESLSLTGS